MSTGVEEMAVIGFCPGMNTQPDLRQVTEGFFLWCEGAVGGYLSPWCSLVLQGCAPHLVSGGPRPESSGPDREGPPHPAGQ